MNLDGSKEWVPENMAFDNNDVESMNSPLIIFSLGHDGIAGSDTGWLWVALNSGSVVLVYGLSVVLVCGLSVMVAAMGVLIGGLSETLDKTFAELLSVMETWGWGLLVNAFLLRHC